jgi:hypothetical protein
VKIYVGAVEAIGRKERGGQNRMKLSLPQKIGAFLSFTPLLNANVFFCKLFFESHPILDQTQGFPDDFMENSIAIRNLHN